MVCCWFLRSIRKPSINPLRRYDRMQKTNSKNRRGFTVIAACLLLSSTIFPGCAMTPPPKGFVDPTRLQDGTYEGSFRGGPNKARVRVSIADHKISSITILEHQAWRGRKADKPIIERIMAAQSTSVDAVSGATNSSRVIMNAVQNAVEKAYGQK